MDFSQGSGDRLAKTAQVVLLPAPEAPETTITRPLIVFQLPQIGPALLTVPVGDCRGSLLERARALVAVPAR